MLKKNTNRQASAENSINKESIYDNLGMLLRTPFNQGVISVYFGIYLLKTGNIIPIWREVSYVIKACHRNK